PGHKGVEDLRAAEQQERLLLRVCRRPGQGLGDGLHRERDPALRSGEREVRELPIEQARRSGAADARPARRGVGCRVRQRSARGDQVLRGLMRAAIGVALAVVLTFSDVAFAQDWPTRPVTMVVPYAAGGPVDAVG